jgi:CRISPR-associated protein (TIGR03986 family)
MSNRITGLTNDKKRILVTPDVGDRPITLEIEKTQATDRALALRVGAEIDKPKPGAKVTKFGNIPPLTGQEPDIDRNPYNFVAFAGQKPWLINPPKPPTPPEGQREAQPEHIGHDEWKEGYFSGRIRFSMKALSPVFVPEGYPWAEEADRDQVRRFGRMRRAAEIEEQYAIAGASLKGLLRSSVEALANDRFGAINEEFYEKPIPYRRRCFQGGIVEAADPDGSYQVHAIEYDYVDESRFPKPFDPNNFTYDRDPYEKQKHYKNVAIPGTTYNPLPGDTRAFKANLLWQPPANHLWTYIVITKKANLYTLPAAVVETYRDNIDHKHYEQHLADHSSAYKSTLPPLDSVKKDLKSIVLGDIVYFTFPKGTNVIDSFGKNVNYLWPASKSVKDLAGPFMRSPKDPLGLTHRLGLAERMFGFVAPHEREKTSHPFRGKVQIETIWGPKTSEAMPLELRLAPLTSPQTRAKSRPLYLEGRPGGSSASYEDRDAQLKGRKVFWHQRWGAALLWEGHAKHSLHPEPQLPPPIEALPKGTKFTGCIHFENLSPPEVGALLYAMSGDEKHPLCLKIGKGKPRGLGSVQFTLNGLDWLEPQRFYGSLEEVNPYKTIKTHVFVEAFQNWCKGMPPRATDFNQIPHIRDYIQLHTFPDRDSVRYYPANFSNYGWLPNDNAHPDEPKGSRPTAMKRARDLKP